MLWARHGDVKELERCIDAVGGGQPAERWAYGRVDPMVEESRRQCRWWFARTNP